MILHPKAIADVIREGIYALTDLASHKTTPPADPRGTTPRAVATGITNIRRRAGK